MRITKRLEIPDIEISETFGTSSGPGGQNVNKVATAVQLRFNLRASRSLPAYVKSNIMRKYHNRINKDGVLIIEANQFRTQTKNRDAAREKLKEIITQAIRRPKKRKRTKPSYRSRQARLDHKKKHSRKKSRRKKIYPD